eukprot:jgi/Chlat1/7943/Chrsp68S07369
MAAGVVGRRLVAAAVAAGRVAGGRVQVVQRCTAVRRAAAPASASGSAGPKGRAMSTLITFDVDGTLIKSVGADANKFHKRAFTYGFQQVFGLDADIDEISHHGSTDQMVALNVLKHRGLKEEDVLPKMPIYCAKMLEFAHSHSSHVEEGLEILPGVKELLEKLSTLPDVYVGLVTGNLQDIGWMKMDALGLKPYFTVPNFGGFGSDHIERTELVKIALQRAQKLSHKTITNRWHVGDTPNDIIAAEKAGATALGLTTGVFSKSELDASSVQKAVVLPGLEDTHLVLKTFGLL